MLERFTYINSFNERLEFGKDCLFVNENDLRNFAWSVTSKNNKISSFKKGIVSKTIPVIIKCNTEAEGILMRNTLFEVFEKDVLAMQYGRIQIGDYYLRCYITGSKKTQYLVNKNHMLVTLTVQTDLPEWIKETSIDYDMFTMNMIPFLDFSYDFPYDYKNELSSVELNNTNFVASNFVMTIYGYVQNPTIYINGYEYSVKCTIGVNEFLTIDSVNKTILLTRANGTKVNHFNDRNKDSYIFEKIPTGINLITSANELIKFKVTLLEERSEPKWT